MSYQRSTSNIFCDTVRATASASGGDTGLMKPDDPYSGVTASVRINPYRLDAVSIKFADEASGDVSVYAVKDGVELLVRQQTVEDATTVIVCNIGLWLKSGDGVKVVNSTGQSADVLVDFMY